MSFTQFLCGSNAHRVTHWSMHWLAHPRTRQEESSMIASCKRSSSISRSLCFHNLFFSQEKTVISPVPYGGDMLHFEYSWIRISCICSKWRWWKTSSNLHNRRGVLDLQNAAGKYEDVKWSLSEHPITTSLHCS